MCCAQRTTKKEHDEKHVGQCKDCGSDVDSNGQCVETNDCSYSPCDCKTCQYSPCDLSC
jgi:hypothetical protein